MEHEPASGSQLAAFVAAGGAITVKGRTFTLDGTAQDGDICVATFRTARARYQGVRCVNTTIASKPGAEVWSIIGTRAAIADVAIHDGRLYAIS